MERPYSDERCFYFDAATVSRLRNHDIHNSMVDDMKDPAILKTCFLSACALEEVPLRLSEKSPQVTIDQPLTDKPASCIKITIARKASTGKTLSCGGFAVVKSLLSPEHDANMNNWIGYKGGVTQLMTKDFVQLLMQKGNVDAGGLETLRKLSLSQVLGAEAAQMELWESEKNPQPKTDDIRRYCSSLIKLWINMWPMFIYWCHVYMILSKIVKKLESSAKPCKGTVDTNLIKQQIADAALAQKPKRLEPSEHHRYKEMLTSIADLIKQLQIHVGDTSCLNVRSKQFFQGRYETYFGQDVDIEPRPVVLTLRFDPQHAKASPPPKSQDYPAQELRYLNLSPAESTESQGIIDPLWEFLTLNKANMEKEQGELQQEWDTRCQQVMNVEVEQPDLDIPDNF